LSDGAIWNIPMTAVNVDVQRPLPQARAVQTPFQNWRVGDSVCFSDQQNREIFGQIIKLNPKRAKVRTPEGIWNVGYDFLTQVVDTEATTQPTMPRISAE
jgi:hypothetical protein